MAAAFQALLPIFGKLVDNFIMAPVYKYIAIILLIVVIILAYKLHQANSK